eukprot:g33371.t1
MYVVLATNIAETSITISGIKYVIDPGVVKQRRYSPKTGAESLRVVPVCKSEAWQRSEPDFLSLNEDLVPEILRCNLSAVVLSLKSLHVNDILAFDFMDPPPKTALRRALEQLLALGALREEDGQLSTLGERMALFPLHPLHSKALLAASLLAACDPPAGGPVCSEEMLSIISLLQVDALFVNPREKRAEATAAKQKFVSI